MATSTSSQLLQKCDDFLFVAAKLDEVLTKLVHKNVAEEDTEGVLSVL